MWLSPLLDRLRRKTTGDAAPALIEIKSAPPTAPCRPFVGGSGGQRVATNAPVRESASIV